MNTKCNFELSEATAAQTMISVGFCHFCQMCSDTFENVFWWSDVNPIILVVDHSFHRKKLLVWSHVNFLCGKLHLLQHFLPSAKPFCLEALERSCYNWILYGFSPKSSFTILLIDRSEISISFAMFLMLLHGFLFILLDVFHDSPDTNWPVSSWNWIWWYCCSPWNFSTH